MSSLATSSALTRRLARAISSVRTRPAADSIFVTSSTPGGAAASRRCTSSGVATLHILSPSRSSRSVLQREARCSVVYSPISPFGAGFAACFTGGFPAAPGAARLGGGGGGSTVVVLLQPGIGLSLYCVLPRASTHLYICACAGGAASSRLASSAIIGSPAAPAPARHGGCRVQRHP